MEGSTLTQRRGECRLEERAIQNDYLMDLGARLALVWQIQRDREKEMKRIWFETRKMPILIEENVRDVTNRPLTEFIAPCIDSLPPLAFTNLRPVPTMLHPHSPLAIRAQDAQRFIVFSYFDPETCHRSTGKREDLSTDTRLSSMLHQYLPHFFDEDSMPPQQRVEGTTEVSVSPVAISHVEEEDRLYPYSLPPLAQRFIGNSSIVLETTQPAVSAKECRVATEATDITAGTATVKREDPWAARSLPLVLPPSLPPVFDDDFMPPEQTVEDTYEVSVATEGTVDLGVYRSAAKCPVPILPPSLPLVFDIDYKLPGEAVEGTTKCPVASETTNDVSTHLKEYMAADQSPPDPAALTPSSLCILDPDHKLTEEKKEDATESSLATEIKGGLVAQGEDLLGDKCPAPMLRSKQPEETVEGATECSAATESSVGSREDPSAAASLPSVLPSSLPLVFDNDHKQLRKKVEEPSPWTLEEATDYLTGIDIESEERSAKEEVGGLKREADRAHSKEENKKLNKKLKYDEKERKEMKAKEEEQKKKKEMKEREKEKKKEMEREKEKKKEMKEREKEKKKKEMKEREKEKKKEMKEREKEKKKEMEREKEKKKEMKEREKEKKKEMKAEKKREKLEQEKREKERKEKEKAEKNRLQGLIKIHNAMMKDRIKKEKKWSEELKRREKAQAEFLEMERKIQEKEEKKREKMRKEERKRLENRAGRYGPKVISQYFWAE